MKKTFTHTQQMSLLTVQHGIIYYSLMEVGHHEGARSCCSLPGRQKRRRGMRPAILGMAEAEEAEEVEGEAGTLDVNIVISVLLFISLKMFPYGANPSSTALVSGPVIIEESMSLKK